VDLNVSHIKSSWTSW